jgi:4-amino-4-deoxy-L-arabinose transferase-like glycosyltransferase
LTPLNRIEPRLRGSPWIAAHPVLLLTLAAIALRVIVFTSRGDYIAFDEGWYLLLGRSLFDGNGYTLSGLRHTTLSPLFAVLAGAVGAIVNDIVWGGRLVAALTAGLLVWPCWHIFRRVGGRSVALIACIFIAVMPSLTPFAAPYWIEWDLWVGAEPVLHFLLFSAIALTLRARERDRMLDWALAGAMFALAFLARPEAVIPFGLTGLVVGVAALVRRSGRKTVHALALALAFALTAAPYWLYLHDTMGRWALTGRAVELPAMRTESANATAGEAARARTGGAASAIERMLWQDDNRPYVRALYGLDESGTRLRSTYWGIPKETADESALPAAALTPSTPDSAAALTPSAAESAAAATSAQESAAPATSAVAAAQPERPGRGRLYVRSLLAISPWFMWLLAVVGIPGRRRAPAAELLVALPLLITSIMIARIVGADPRTQLLIVPLVAFYAARGVQRIGDAVERYAAGAELRRGFVGGVAAAVVSLALLSTVTHWVYMGLSMGSPHHTVGAANHALGDALKGIVPADEPVMSWHPATALYADREWRVLPYAPFDDIIRYANASRTEYIVLSAFYPGSQLVKGLERDHLVLHVPPDAPPSPEHWQIEMQGAGSSHVLGHLRYTAETPGAQR